jgi:hypothetical protein
MRHVAIASALLFLIASDPATAQMSSFFRNLGLTPNEMDLARAAAESLYEKAGVVPGKSAEWTSETSSAAGSVEVLDVTDGGRCVRFVHRVRPEPDARQQPMELRRCRSDEGKWILAP